MPPNDAQTMLFQAARTARRLAPNEEPALKPNHPNLDNATLVHGIRRWWEFIPKDESTQGYHGHVVWPEIAELFLLSASENPGVGKTSDPRTNLNWATT